MFQNIDMNITMRYKPQLYLTNSSREIIASVTDAYSIVNSTRLMSTNELDFDIPYFSAVNNVVQNSDDIIEKTKPRYYIKFISNYIPSWYILSNISDNNDGSKDIRKIKCYSLEYELRDKTITDYKAESLTLQQMLQGKPFVQVGILDSKDGWTIGTIDKEVSNLIRGVSLSGLKTVLDCIYEVAKLFNVIVSFDTVNKQISFTLNKNLMVNKGLTFDYKKYLQQINVEDKTDEIVTRLTVIGKDGASIENYTSTGVNYLQDFSYFMYPYEKVDLYSDIQPNFNISTLYREKDIVMYNNSLYRCQVETSKGVLPDNTSYWVKNGTTIHSHYMSDELCEALLNYAEFLNNNQNQLANVVNKQKILIDALSSANNQLNDAEDDFKTICAKYDLLQTAQESIADVAKAKTAQEKSLNIIKNKVSDLQSQLDENTKILASKRFSLSMEANMSFSLLDELNRFTIKKDYNNSEISDGNMLYQLAIEQFEMDKLPKLNVTLDIINFQMVVREQFSWDLLDLGDEINVIYNKFGLKIKAQVTELIVDYENNTIKLTISNVKYFKTDYERYAKIIYNVTSTSAVVSNLVGTVSDLQDEYKTFKDILGTFVNLQNKSINILSGVSKSVLIDNRGITTTDSINPNNMIRLNNGNLMISNSGENGLTPLINGSGLVGSSGNSSNSNSNIGTGNEIITNVPIDVFDGKIRTTLNKQNKIILVESYYDKLGGYVNLNNLNGQKASRIICLKEDNKADTTQVFINNRIGGNIQLYDVTTTETNNQMIEIGTKVATDKIDATKQYQYSYLNLNDKNNKSKVVLQSSEQQKSSDYTTNPDGSALTVTDNMYTSSVLNMYDKDGKKKISLHSNTRDSGTSDLQFCDTNETPYFSFQGDSVNKKMNLAIDNFNNLTVTINRGIPMLLAMTLFGNANFSSRIGTVITHNLSSLVYVVDLTCTEDPQGNLGEIWYVKGDKTFTVYNSGIATTGFDWKIIR